MDIYALGVCCWALALATNHWPPVLSEMPPQTSAKAPSLSGVFGASLDADVVNLLDRCLEPMPQARPTAREVAFLLRKHLLRGAHKGIFVQSGSNIYELSSAKPNVRIAIPSLGELRVAYDGISFRVTQVIGVVLVNNVPLVIGMELYDACVLTFGDFALGASRQWITFLSSHPELNL